MNIFNWVVRTVMVGLLLVLARPGVAQQAYPAKPISIITSGAGGSADLAACVLARELTLSLRQQVTVDNRASAIIPIDAVAAATPDGYTLLVSGGALWIGPVLQNSPGRDVFRNFVPITLATSAPNILAVHPSLPVDSVAELIAYARAHPGQIVYPAGVTGSSSHIAGELFNLMAGVGIVRAGYASTGRVVDELISGTVQLMFGLSSVIAPYLGTGKVRALAVTSAQPSAVAPGLPTVAAAGLPGYESETMIGLFAPAGTPSPIVETLNRECVRILRRPEIRDEIRSAGMDSVGNTSAEFADCLRSELARLEKLRDRIKA